jgi:hypothetical protein
VPDKNAFDTTGKINIDGTGLSNSVGGQSVPYPLSGIVPGKEKAVVFGSDGGDYTAKASLSSGSVKIVVTSSATGKVVYETTIKEDSSHTERDPVVRILDDAKTIIVLFGNRQADISTIVTFEQF